MKSLVSRLTFLLFVLASSAAWAAPPSCGLQRVAELPVKVDSGQLLVKMQINDQDGWFVIDTGSAYNMLTRQMVDALKLQPLPVEPNLVVYDGSGTPLRHYVVAKKLTMSGMVAEDKEFLVMGENTAINAPIAGVFGASFLAAYDLELDIPHGKIRLFTQDHCKGQVVYWTQDFAVVPFSVDEFLHITLEVNLDGNTERALLDTGATPTTISAQTARRTFNVDPGAEGAAPDGQVTGGSGKTLPFYRHKFANLNVGGVEFHNTELEVMPDKLTRMMRDHANADGSGRGQTWPLTIGLHHLARIRAYIAYGEGKLYISAADAN